MSHKKDLTRPRPGKGEDFVFVTEDGRSLPLLRTVFMNGIELTLPVDARVRVDYSGNELTEVSFSVFAGRIETITESEMEDRLIR